MKPSEMKTIYQESCRTAANRPVPDEAQEKIWRQIMIGFDPADLRGGLAIWWQTEKYLPMPAELKPLAERARRERMAKAQEKQDLVGWTCPECGIHASGFISPTDHEPRVCRGVAKGSPQLDEWGRPIPCGAILEETHRGTAGKVVTQYARG